MLLCCEFQSYGKVFNINYSVSQKLIWTAKVWGTPAAVCTWHDFKPGHLLIFINYICRLKITYYFFIWQIISDKLTTVRVKVRLPAVYTWHDLRWSRKLGRCCVTSSGQCGGDLKCHLHVGLCAVVLPRQIRYWYMIWILKLYFLTKQNLYLKVHIWPTESSYHLLLEEAQMKQKITMKQDIRKSDKHLRVIYVTYIIFT